MNDETENSTAATVAETDHKPDVYAIKYFKLLRKCEAIKLDNERLINYIHQVNKLIRKQKRQRRLMHCQKSNHY